MGVGEQREVGQGGSACVWVREHRPKYHRMYIIMPTGLDDIHIAVGRSPSDSGNVASVDAPPSQP